MNLEGNMNRHHFEIRFLLILALFPVIVVIVQLYYTYQNIAKTYHVEGLITRNMEMQQWDTIEGIISENEKRARLQAENIKNNIKHDLLLVYKDNMDQLNEDLDSHDKTRACYKILKTNIEHKFMNVDSFDNRAYIADKKGILVDRSIVKEDRDNRLWETEIESNADPITASKAIDMILLKDNHIIYWVTAESAKSPKSKDYQQLSFETIKDDISQNGITALKSYDILVPAYVPNESTVLNTPEMIIHGVPETNRKLIVIQSFNLYDAFMVHSNDIEKLNSTTDLVRKIIRETIYTDIVTLVLVVILTLITFGATIYGAYLLIKWSVKDGNENWIV